MHYLILLCTLVLVSCNTVPVAPIEQDTASVMQRFAYDHIHTHPPAPLLPAPDYKTYQLTQSHSRIENIDTVYLYDLLAYQNYVKRYIVTLAIGTEQEIDDACFMSVIPIKEKTFYPPTSPNVDKYTDTTQLYRDYLEYIKAILSYTKEIETYYTITIDEFEDTCKILSLPNM